MRNSMIDKKLLYYASSDEENLEYVCYCLYQGASVHARDQYDRTPLMLASYAGNLKIIKKLIEGRSYINAKDCAGYTALHLARKPYVVKQLIKLGADVNIRTRLGETPLMLQVVYQNISSIRFLVKAGADVNASDKNNETALIKAVQCGRYSIAKYLISSGADVNALSVDGMTPLMWALFTESYDITELLLKEGADINVEDIRKKTALDYAVETELDGLVALIDKWDKR